MIWSEAHAVSQGMPYLAVSLQKTVQQSTRKAMFSCSSSEVQNPLALSLHVKTDINNGELLIGTTHYELNMVCVLLGSAPANVT